MSDLAYRVDRAGQDEMSLVLKSWARCYRGEPANLRMPQRAFYLWQRDMIDRLLERGATVLVARDAERPAFLFGWLCAERLGRALAVHYAFVKRAFRERGIGHAMLAAAVERLGDGAEELWQTHGCMELDAKLRGMGFARVGIEQVLREPRRAA